MSIKRILTTDFVREHSLYKLDTSFYSDGQLKLGIDKAISRIEASFGLELTSHPDRVFEDHFDKTSIDDSTWHLKRLTHLPVMEIKSLQFKWGAYAAAKAPVSWARMNPAAKIHGQVQIQASGVGIVGYTADSLHPLVSAFGTGSMDLVPNYIQFTYTAGFALTLAGTASWTAGNPTVTFSGGELITQDLRTGHYVESAAGEVRRVERVISETELELTSAFDTTSAGVTMLALMHDPLILETVALMAAEGPLVTASDLALGSPGLAGKSVSADGLSTSIQTTASATYGLFSARLQENRRILAQNLDAIRAKYEPFDAWIV